MCIRSLVVSVMYLTCTMFLGTLSVCMTVLVLNIHHRDSERPVPKWVRILCFKYLARLLCVTGRKPKSLAELERRVEMETHAHKHENTLKEGLRKMTHDAHILQPLMNGDVIKPSHQHHHHANHAYSRCHHQKQFVTTAVAAAGATTTTSDALESPTNDSETRNGDEFAFPLLTKATDKRKKYWHNNAYEWKEVAHILDQLFFILMLISMTASFMIIIMVPFYKTPYQPRATVDPNA